jgi:hypothetical protein
MIGKSRNLRDSRPQASRSRPQRTHDLYVEAIYSQRFARSLKSEKGKIMQQDAGGPGEGEAELHRPGAERSGPWLTTGEQPGYPLLLLAMGRNRHDALTFHFSHHLTVGRRLL